MQNNTDNKQPEKKPDEAGQILVDEHIKISDPATGEVLLNKRDSNV